jgi:hypothetical protein
LEFYEMPGHLQEIWIEHVTNTWTGAYASKGDGKQTGAQAMAAQDEWIAKQGGEA